MRRCEPRLRQLQRTLGITTVYVTHDQAEAMVLSDRVVVMDGGRIQQQGSPQDIYNRPVNRFVAEFVGFDNFLPGVVVEHESGEFRVAMGTQNTIFRCPSREALTVGADVLLGVRSSNVAISPDAFHGAPNVLQGVVTQSLYYGDAIEYRVSTGDLEVIASMSDRDTAGRPDGQIRVGEPVHVRIDPDLTVALAAT